MAKKAAPLKVAKPRTKAAGAKARRTPSPPERGARQPVGRKSGTSKPRLKAAVSKPVVRRAPARKPLTLGRPLVRADEKLDMLFHEDYHARQIFEFLRVDTVADLEQLSPQQIIQILSAPVRNTVERIRERLADNRRHLRDDAAFAQARLKH